MLRIRTALSSLTALAVATDLAAQTPCAPTADPAFGVPGVEGAAGGGVRRMQLWDRDGAGPMPAEVLMAGNILAIGAEIYAVDSGVASWEPATAAATIYDPLLEGGGWRCAVGGNNRAYLSATPEPWHMTPSHRVYEFDGQWQEVGGVDGSPELRAPWHTMEALPNGDLIAGLYDRGANPGRMAIWNGSTWSDLGLGMFGTTYCSLAHSSGDIYVAGQLFQINVPDGGALGIAANGMARWDGSTWHPVGSGVNDVIFDIHELPNGDVVAVGDFTEAGGLAVDRVAVWNGSSWNALPGGGVFGAAILTVTQLADGDLIVGGTFNTSTGAVANRVARYDGTNWTAIGSGIDDQTVRDVLELPDGRLLASGSFLSAGGRRCRNVAVFDGQRWDAIGQGVAGTIEDIEVAADGRTYIAGPAEAGGAIGGTGNAYVFDGSTWDVIPGAPSAITDIDPRPNGDVVVAGAGVPGGVQIYDGTAWSVAAAGIDVNTTTDAELLDNGQLLVGTEFTLGTFGGLPNRGLGIYDGSNWLNLASPGPTNFIGSTFELVPVDGGCLVAGFFSAGQPTAARSIALWDGTQFQPVGSGSGANNGSGTIYACDVGDDGQIYVGGQFTDIDGVPAINLARFDGSSWHAITAPADAPNGAVDELLVLPSGDICITGSFSVPFDGAARLRNGQWEELAPTHGDVEMAIAPDGAVWVGAGPTRLVTGCSAQTSQPTPGCPSSGGANTLTATTQPWIGTSYEARGEGLPNFALVGVVTGFATTSIPLAIVSPVARAGCTLGVTPDLVDFVPTITGEVELDLPLPNSSSLVGQELLQQLVPFEIDPKLQVLEVTATNSLRAVIGAL